MSCLPPTVATFLSRFRWAMGALLLVALGVGAVKLASAADSRVGSRIKRLVFVTKNRLLAPVRAPKLFARTLTEDLRKKGYNECYPYDFVGLGPYAPYRRLLLGRMAIPQRGGHTADYGYDVLIHFHGKTALQMTLSQIARGVSFVGIDLGNGSGIYSDRFTDPQSFPPLRQSIENALRAHSGQPGAHIRHLGLMAWSAGYGAVNEILRYNADQIDAVVLLDGLHGSWDMVRPRRQKPRFEDVVAGQVEPVFAYAKQALAGKGIFIFTHSYVDPLSYPSTSLTAQALLHSLGVVSSSVEETDEPYGMIGAADVRGFHVWSYRGHDRAAHCTHLAHVEHAVRDVIEPAWNTPAMDRDVPMTPAPKLGPAVVSSPPSSAPEEESESEARRTDVAPESIQSG